MKKSKFPIGEFFVLILGEVIVSLVMLLVYFFIDKFSYKVITGAVLGSALTVINFIIMAFYTGRAFDRAIEARGTREMSEEEIEEFTREQRKSVEAASKLSYIIRTFVMIGALVLAFISGFFDVIATVVPFLMFRPILTVDAIIKSKKARKETDI